MPPPSPTLALAGVVASAAWVALVVLIAAAVFALGWAPGAIARARKHPSASGVAAVGFLGLAFWPAWFLALGWAFATNGPAPVPRRRPPATDHTPPEDRDDPYPELPGRFDVRGVDRASGMDTRLIVEAESAANARVKAELRGVAPTRVIRADDDGPPPGPP